MLPITEGYAADWTMAQLRGVAQHIADRIDELICGTASGASSRIAGRVSLVCGLRLILVAELLWQPGQHAFADRHGSGTRYGESSLRTPRSAPVAGEWAAPPPRHVLHAETGPRFVEPDRIEQPAVPVEHRPVLFMRRIEDRLQKIHETVRCPPTSSGGQRRAPPTKAGYSRSGSPSRTSSTITSWRQLSP